MENPQTLGEHLKRARQHRNVYQKDVAKELGVNQWTLIGYNPLPEPISVAGRMKHHRLSLGLTQERAAREVGIDESTWWKHENERQSLTTSVRVKIEKWLRVTD